MSAPVDDEVETTGLQRLVIGVVLIVLAIGLGIQITLEVDIDIDRRRGVREGLGQEVLRIRGDA